jgi:hypothetical protein
MIFAEILTRKNEAGTKARRRIAVLNKYEMSISKLFEGAKGGILNISGKGQHQKSDALRDEYFFFGSRDMHSGSVSNPDYIDELKVSLEAEDVKSIVRAAIQGKVIELKDLLSKDFIENLTNIEERLSEAQDELNTVVEKL